MGNLVSEPNPKPDPGKTTPIVPDRAADTAPVPQGAGDSTPASAAEAEQMLQEAAKSGTNLDTIVSRLVIEQNLATEDEVRHCMERVKQMREENNQASLVQLLLNNEYVTKRQIARLRQSIEAERSGQKIPGYKIEKKLGAGAMATVWKARQLRLDRDVAIKILPRKFTNNPQFIERFIAEGRSAAQLNHPNIVQAYDVDKAGDLYFFVMEYVDGRTVYDDITKHKRLSEREAIEIAIQIADALQHAHSKGLIHRDVKPKNIMITKEGVAKLADMGLARAVSDKEMAEAEAGKAFGTPYYISPEQIRGERQIGPPADIYSLGATLYHMVTGSVPYDGPNPSAVMHKHLKAELVPPDHVNPKLSAGISQIIEMMMAKDPKARYQKCSDVRADLLAVRDGKNPVIAHKDWGVDLAGIAQAEAAAVGEIAAPAATPSDSFTLGALFRQPLVILMLVLLVVSIAINIILASRS